jgi:hypothetical protein
LPQTFVIERRGHLALLLQVIRYEGGCDSDVVLQGAVLRTAGQGHRVRLGQAAVVAVEHGDGHGSGRGKGDEDTRWDGEKMMEIYQIQKIKLKPIFFNFEAGYIANEYMLHVNLLRW